MTPELAEYFGAKNGGALVSSVAKESAAAKAGIKAGDVIVSINGKAVSDADDLIARSRHQRRGDDRRAARQEGDDAEGDDREGSAGRSECRLAAGARSLGLTGLRATG